LIASASADRTGFRWRVIAGAVGLALLAGCAAGQPAASVSTRRAAAASVADPQASYNAARILEGAYLASGHANASTLVQLLERDRAARKALERMHTDPAGGRDEARAAVARLAELLISDAEF
jgi:hypothetical protein